MAVTFSIMETPSLLSGTFCSGEHLRAENIRRQEESKIVRPQRVLTTQKYVQTFSSAKTGIILGTTGLKLLNFIPIRDKKE